MWVRVRVMVGVGVRVMVRVRVRVKVRVRLRLRRRVSALRSGAGSADHGWLAAPGVRPLSQAMAP